VKWVETEERKYRQVLVASGKVAALNPRRVAGKGGADQLTNKR